MLVFTLYKSRNRKKDIVLLLNYAGFSYIFEYIVVVLFDGYVYKPRFLKQKNLDNIFGAILSQFFYVPVTSLFITVFKMGWKAKIVFSCYFVLIEKLFIFLGVFKNKWWRTRYTFLVILTSFYLNDLWNEQLNKKNPVSMFISFFNLIQVTWMNTIYFFAVTRKIRYGFLFFLSWKEHFIVAPFFGYIISLLSAYWIRKENFISNLLNLITISMIDQILIKNRMLKIKSPFILPIIYSIIMLTSSYYSKLIYEPLET